MSVCGSGSGQIGIILADPDRDGISIQALPIRIYPFQPNIKLTVLFSRQNIENYDTYESAKKDKTM
jgi:hypothetical protein